MRSITDMILEVRNKLPYGWGYEEGVDYARQVLSAKGIALLETLLETTPVVTVFLPLAHRKRLLVREVTVALGVLADRMKTADAWLATQILKYHFGVSSRFIFRVQVRGRSLSRYTYYTYCGSVADLEDLTTMQYLPASQVCRVLRHALTSYNLR